MSRIKVMQDMFKRYRQPGDFLFAIIFLLFTFFLMFNLNDQVTWAKSTKLSAQPAFWPTLSILCMTAFALLHALSSGLSPKLAGRWLEVAFWLRSLEYAAWFMAYVVTVPIVGYLPSTIMFMLLLAYRVGYRKRTTFFVVLGVAVFIVLLFKTFLQVKVPGGQLYEIFPTSVRAFMLTFF